MDTHTPAAQNSKNQHRRTHGNIMTHPVGLRTYVGIEPVPDRQGLRADHQNAVHPAVCRQSRTAPGHRRPTQQGRTGKQVLPCRCGRQSPCPQPDRTGCPSRRRRLQPPDPKLHHLLELSLSHAADGDDAGCRRTGSVASHHRRIRTHIMGTYQPAGRIRFLGRKAARQHRNPAPEISRLTGPRFQEV